MTSVWGPPTWRFLHEVADALPVSNVSDEKAAAFTNLIKALPHLLPCPACQSHFLAYLESNPLPKEISKISAKQWMHDVHNSVNKRLGKPELSFEEAERAFKKPYTEISTVPSLEKKNQSFFTIGLFAAIILTAILFTLFKTKKISLQKTVVKKN